MGRILRFSHPQPMFSNHIDRRLLNFIYKALRASCLFGGFRALQLACWHLSGALGGPSWHSSTRDLETRNRVEDAPWDIRALPAASPRSPRSAMPCCPVLVENKLVNVTEVNWWASLCDKFKQIEGNCLNWTQSKSWPNLLPRVLPTLGEPEPMTSCGQFAHIYAICHHSVCIVWRLQDLPLASLWSQRFENHALDVLWVYVCVVGMRVVCVCVCVFLLLRDRKSTRLNSSH